MTISKRFYSSFVSIYDKSETSRRIVYTIIYRFLKYMLAFIVIQYSLFAFNNMLSLQMFSYVSRYSISNNPLMFVKFPGRMDNFAAAA